MVVLKVLALNAGSSSFKASLFRIETPGEEGDEPTGLLWEKQEEGCDNIGAILSSLWSGPDRVIASPAEIDAVGHRVVFGGSNLTGCPRITEAVRRQLERVSEYAPAHNAAALAGMDAASDALGNNAPQFAVFDTEFHRTLRPAAFTYAGPASWVGQGIRRFGFHGLSHRYTSHRAARIMSRGDRGFRVVTCHLGSGCSLAAVRGGQSVDTTMGFTPVDGLPMARRSGAIDPGILIHLLRHSGETVDSLDRTLNHDSGLAGLSGTSGDMREVLAAIERSEAPARLALDVFVHWVRKGIAAMAASIGGIDALVFAGGVGEHVPRVRAEILSGLEFLGLELDETLNTAASAETLLSTTCSAAKVVVIPAEENWVMARDCFAEAGKTTQ